MWTCHNFGANFPDTGAIAQHLVRFPGPEAAVCVELCFCFDRPCRAKEMVDP